MKPLAVTSRRNFLKTSALLTGGLLIPFVVPAAIRRMDTAPEAAALFAPNAFLRIGADDSIQVLLAHSEMGQGIWTTLAMLVAEELDTDVSKIKVEHAPAAPAYHHTVVPTQMTGGSTTTWSEFDRYRQAGAAARVMLIQAAAQRFGVKPEACRTENGMVIAGNQRIRYGELAAAASTLPVPANVPLRSPAQWRYIGKGVKRLDAPAKVNGTARFGMDMQFEGLLTAVVAHPPVFGATVKSFDDSKTRSMPGVRDVVQIPTGVAVIADHFWAAKRGRDVLKVTWDPGPNAGIDSAALLQEYQRLARTQGLPAAQAGNVDAGMAKAVKTVEAEYTFPYLAHAPMEPLNCTVKLTNNSCEIWTGTHFQIIDQTAAAKALGFKPEQVKVNTVMLGGGFGRRASKDSDFVLEAVHIAKASGKFIKMVWTREDDMRAGYYRPAFLHRVRVGLGADGLPLAWQHTIVGQSILGGSVFEGAIKNGIDNASVEGVADSPYLKQVPDYYVGLHSPKVGVPVLWFRSVGNTHTAPVMECMIDELARAAGKDPLEYRRMLLKDHPRHLAALNLAAEKAGWGQPLPAGRFRGIAVHESFLSYVAQVAEISIDDNGFVKVHRVTCAIDCGLAVNPDGVRSQIEGGINFGLSAALYGEITLEKGTVQQRNFHDYRVARMNDTPPVIEVHIVDSTEKMGGAGECGVPPIAPAIANAVLAATGKPVRRFPFGTVNLKA